MHPSHLKFCYSVNDDEYEKVLSYQKVIDSIEKDEDNPIMWKFKRIVSHQGPLTPTSPGYNGSSYNVCIEWENGEVTGELLSTIAADNPVTCAIHARDYNLLDKPGWRRFCHLAKRQKKLFRMVNQAKLKSFRTAPRYKYGYEVPRDYITMQCSWML